MNFLKKMGRVVLQVVGIATGMAPLVTRMVPGAGAAMGEIAAIGNVIVTVEQTFSAAYGPDAKKGSDKLRAAVPFVAALIQQSELVAGKKISNEPNFIAACTDITNGFVKLLNSLGAARGWKSNFENCGKTCARLRSGRMIF
jgi:hypothetical protein